MRFYQRYNKVEYLFGEQTVIFIITDEYNKLFTALGENDKETDIFYLGTVKKDLNLDEGSFAVDELSFTVDQMACTNEDDEKALFFLLQASDVLKNRFCAVYFGDAIALDNLLFMGKISDKISGTDELWEGGEYATERFPQRTYKFTAYSLDISILEKIKFTEEIKDQSGNPINNIYDHFTDGDLQQLFISRLAYGYDQNGRKDVKFVWLGNLYNVLQYYLSKASLVLNDLLGVSINLVLNESELGFSTYPTAVTLFYDDNEDIGGISRSNELREIRLSATENGEEQDGTKWSTVFIQRRMVEPKLGHNPSTVKQWEIEQEANEKPFSFKSFNNLADFLFALAKNFGCYLTVQNDGNTWSFSFIPRWAIVENNFTYIINSEEASINTSSHLESKKTRFYGSANNIACEGMDEIRSNFDYGNIRPSACYLRADDERRKSEKYENVEYHRLPLTTSSTVEWGLFNGETEGCSQKYYFEYSLLFWINTSSNTINWANPYLRELYTNFINSNCAENGIVSTIERLHTGIYIKTTPQEAFQKDLLGETTPVWRPALGIAIKINNEDVYFENLSKYVNYLLDTDRHFYTTEYEWTIPFWRGFSKQADGSDASWRNLRLGSKVKIIEKIRDEQGEVQEVERNFVVVSIEVNLQQPETKLKLQSIERFSYFSKASSSFTPPELTRQWEREEPKITEDAIVKNYIIADNEMISKGDAVMILSNGKIAKTRAHSDYYKKTIGIALEGGNEGDEIRVQIAGRVTLPEFSFSNIGGFVYARTNESGSNISTVLLTEPTYTEDMIVCLGTVVSEKSFILEIIDLPFASGVRRDN